MNEGEEGPSSLLDPRGSGWKLKMAWLGLFRLYVKGEEAMAELSTELQAIENNLNRGHSRDDKDAPKLKRALFLLALFALGKREGAPARVPFLEAQGCGLGSRCPRTNAGRSRMRFP
jgi:hypothetical protein